MRAICTTPLPASSHPTCASGVSLTWANCHSTRARTLSQHSEIDVRLSPRHVCLVWRGLACQRLRLESTGRSTVALQISRAESFHERTQPDTSVLSSCGVQPV